MPKRKVSRIMGTIANGSKRFIGYLADALSPPTIATGMGLASVTVGLWMVAPPLAFIVPGALVLVFGLWLAGAFGGQFRE